MRLIPRLSRDASSYSDSSNTTEGSSTPSEMAGVTATATEQFLRPRPELAPYEVPPSDGSSRLLTCPPEVLVGIFSRLDRGTFTTCMRLCRTINELLETNTELKLHHTLLCNSLSLNPHALRPSSNINLTPPAPGKLLDELRERITRFHNFNPKARHEIRLQEPDGRLYEYLEGVLLRGITPTGETSRRSLPKDVAVYDLRTLGDWEDVPGTSRRAVTTERSGESQDEDIVMQDVQADAEGEGETQVRSVRKFDFRVAEFAVDPGQDLLVIVEVRTQSVQHHTMHFHLLTLSTREPHTRASVPVLQWPVPLLRRNISLAFQICDDGLFVLSQNIPGRPHCQLSGWQWTTGRLAVTLKAPGTMSFENFVLLTPWSFVVPTIVTHLDPLSANQDVLDDPSDLSWTHHLHVYAFAPFSSIKLRPGEPHPPPHSAVHIKTIDLPRFLVDFERQIPPPRLSIRADPPPRHDPPTHPEGRQAPFHPDPESGIFIIDVYGQMPEPERPPHYQIVLLKSVLLPYLPSPDSSLLTTAFPRPAAIVPWPDIAPKVRMFIPDALPSPWVCFVYQNRFVTEGLGDGAVRNGPLRWSIYDFDPLRVRKLQLERRQLAKWRLAAHRAECRAIAEGTVDQMRPQFTDDDDPWFDALHVDGITLCTEETVLADREPLLSEIRTGSEFPYMCVNKSAAMQFDYRGDDSIMLLDESRLVLILSDEEEEEEGDEAPTEKTRIMVMEF